MQNLMRELECIMSEELGLYVGILQYAKCKKEALINNDVDEINRLSRLESESLERIKCAAHQRESLFAKIASADGYKGKVDFAYLVGRLPADEREQLEEIRGKYNKIIQELKDLNALNQNLLRMQLQYTSFCIDTIMQMEPVGGTYGSSGQMTDTHVAPRRFIEREA